MKKLILLPALLLCTASAFALGTVQEKSAKLHSPARKVTAVPQNRAWGWLQRDRGGLDKGIVSFDLSQPENLEQVHILPDRVWAGIFADGGYYFYRYRDDAAAQDWAPLAFSSVDLATGKITDIASWANKDFIFNDMAYDRVSGNIYALSREIYADDFLSSLTFEYSGLYTVNAATGVATQVKQFINWNSGAMANPTYLTITADLQGNIYVIDINGLLYRLDSTDDWNAILIGDTGRRPTTNVQSMDYDPATGKIYWAADYKTQVSDLCVVDPLTAETQVVASLGNDSRLCGLHIDYTLPREGAPAGVANLSATGADGGAQAVTLSWITPAKTFGGAYLVALDKLTVTRDGQTVYTVSAPATGAPVTWTDNNATTGYHNYIVNTSNALGEGLAAKTVVWVGHDVPDAVGHLGIGRNDDGSAHLVWDAPAQGLHGGWIDAATLTYDITRLPDNVKVATALKDTQYDDNTIKTSGKFSYTVTPSTADGQGPAATTVEIALGNQISQFPYNCNFEDQSVFNTWTVVNANGGSTWTWKRRGLADFDAFAMYQYDNDNTGDDYLISPALALEAGAGYSLRFNYRGSNGNYTEKLEVVFGTEPTKEGMAQTLKTYSFKTGDGTYDTVVLPEITQSGNYYIGFHAVSDPKCYNVYISGITIDQTSAPAPPQGQYPAATDLCADVNHSAHTVTLTWNHPHYLPDSPADGTNKPIFDDFESYDKWTINPTGKYAWTYIDGDGGIPYRSDYADMPYPTDGQPLAAMIMAPYELGDAVATPNPPYSGEQYLLFKSNYAAGDGSRPAPAPRDLIISPKLAFTTDFVLSFMCKADPDLEAVAEGWTGDDVWNREQFRVGYSTGGNAETDFIWVTDTNEEITSTGDTWRNKEYALPAAARYVCIKYCTPRNGFWFMVDDIYIGPAGALSPARAIAQGTGLSHFEVYLDDAHTATTQANSHTLENLTEGNHTAHIIAVFQEGRSQATAVNFSVDATGAITVTTPDTPADYYDLRGIRITQPTKGIAIDRNTARKVLIK